MSFMRYCKIGPSKLKICNYVIIMLFLQAYENSKLGQSILMRKEVHSGLSYAYNMLRY